MEDKRKAFNAIIKSVGKQILLIDKVSYSGVPLLATGSIVICGSLVHIVSHDSVFNGCHPGSPFNHFEFGWMVEDSGDVERFISSSQKIFIDNRNILTGEPLTLFDLL